MKKQLENISLSLIFCLLALAGIALGCGGGGSSSDGGGGTPPPPPPPSGGPGDGNTTSPT